MFDDFGILWLTSLLRNHKYNYDKFIEFKRYQNGIYIWQNFLDLIKLKL